MANNFTQIVDKIFARALLALRENAIMPRLVNTNWGAEVAQPGDTINVPIPSAMEVSDVVPGPTPPAGGDVAPTTVPIQLNRWRKVDMHVTDKEAREIAQGGREVQLSEAMKALANDVDAYLLGLYTGIYGFAGTPGTTPFGGESLQAATDARKVLGQQLAPSDPRFIVLNPDAEANALLIRAVQDASFRANQENTLRTGRIGTLLGFDWFMDQQVKSHTAGTGAGYLVNQANHAVGDTTVTVDTGTGTILPGDIFTVAGDTQTYVVKSFAGNVITYAPAAKTAFADNAAITLKGNHVVNLAFHRDAFALAVRPLAPADGFTGGHEIRTGVDPVSGLALTLEISREYNRTKYQWSILYGASLVRPELAARIAG
ncbi:MAG TPA: P22 phage major capsid protein family protein [Longimicrobiales bacterium]